ncbi:MAG: HAD-IIB family hydrolase [Christensenella sp.]|nr:HAD-IIB family hydrolase [Christensenella sp.]
MGVYDGYYLYCDLDGTLLDEEKRVSAENYTAIRSFVEQGGHFGVATGRVPLILGSVEHHMPINAPCILYNGAGLYDLTAGEFLARHAISPALAAEAAACVISAKGNACVQIFTDSAIYEVNPNQRADPQTAIEQIPVISSSIDQISGTVLKLLISHLPDELNEIQAAVEKAGFAERFTLVRTSSTYLEFVASGVSKGAALSDVRARCGNVKKILAIGDYNNDLEMVSLADIGGAPANAIDEVKSAADIVLTADHNHSCVARFLEVALS